MMTSSWIERVSKYLDSLQGCVERLNEALDETRVGTTTLDAPGVNSGSAELSSCLKDLEALIAERQQLLDADDAPLSGVSLRDVLNRCGLPGASSVADRCHLISRDVDLSRERAVSLFVCQFHLSDLSTHLLALLRSGADQGATYERGKSDVKRSEVGGSVFNRAA
jgi:hypothetical protein